MDNSTPTASIVAAAMSTANLTLAPDSPKISAAASPQNHHIHVVASPVQHARSPSHNLPRTESMEVSEHQTKTHPLIKQPSQDADSPNQRSMETTPGPTLPPSSQLREEEGEKTVVLRTDGKDPHMVTVTPPAPYSSANINGDSRMQHVMMYNSSDKQLLNTIPVNMHLVPKMETSESETYSRTKEDTTYPITCGNNKAELVWKKFICPGINAKCVKYGDSWFTPKEFVSSAGKSTLKDWKRAIRINGIMLRKMIENGDLNYFDHENNCSNQCRSNKSSSFDAGEKPYNSFESDTSMMHRDQSLESVPGRSNSEDLPFLNSKRPSHHKSQDSTSIAGVAGSLSGSLERSSSEDSGLAASPHIDGMLMRETTVTIDKIQDHLGFWNGIIRMELFEDIIRDVITQISNLYTKTTRNGSITTEDVVVMTNIINSLEMMPSIAHKMSLHKHNVEKQAEESTHTIQELEKRLAEQRKFEQDLKRKSQHLENVISLTPTEKRQKRNIIRIGRQKAVESRVPPGVMPGSSSPISSSIRDNVMIGSVGRLQQRDLWPQAAIQVEGISRAASSQMARMNVSGTSAQAAMPAIPPFTIFTPNIHTNPDVFVSSSSLHQAFVTSQAHHSSRESTQSPKK